ncbi:PfkB family carbohydrate kinase [Oceanimonas sp. GK1]|jgi:sugar/nucleoside kinase (ribokinase family)|uniref:PfkB family carbohydrate kinase n=1 Tax=Oceanimonas sp. (strain GK1 / IBRC-M 10197) TaxID=511062 RepID=UPI0002494D64|nr:PfkB family carbohydrate kinase [Oceanimonas sp. GK1]AEX99774.1 PfkB family carbohydrate kinase [Oceanimonas sp. GK1]
MPGANTIKKNIMLLANLNCDHVLQLDAPLTAGARLHYRDAGRRLGGGAANTGAGLCWAGHRVTVLARVGRDPTGDWLLQQAEALGLNLDHVERVDDATGELLVLVDSQGERTILRQARAPALPARLPQAPVDCLYVNTEGAEVATYMDAMNRHSLVISQYPRGGRWPRPCRIMMASAADMGAVADPWQQARALAGEGLEWLVLTHGEDGAEAISAGRRICVPAPVVTAVDATGAGDAFAGGLIHALVAGASMDDALTEAGRWAAFTLASISSIPSGLLRDYLAGELNFPAGAGKLVTEKVSGDGFSE